MPAEPFPYNSVTLEGNLGRDPRVSVTPGGTAVAEVSIAVYDGKDRNGEKKTVWVPIKAFKELAYVLGDCSKGDRVRVLEGKISQDSWTDKDTGKPRTRLVVIAWQLEKVQPHILNKPQEPNYDEVPF